MSYRRVREDLTMFVHIRDPEKDDTVFSLLSETAKVEYKVSDVVNLSVTT